MSAVVPSSVRPEISPDALLVPLPPYEAYVADVERLDGRAPLGPTDDAWLALAHALARAAALPRAERASVCGGGARMIAATLAELPAPDPLTLTDALADAGADVGDVGADRARAVTLAAADALGAAAEWLGQLGTTFDDASGAVPSGALADAVAALQTLVAQEEQAGAFLLAFSTLAAARRALAPVLDARSRGLLLAQQGRVARQLGALAHAARLYRAAARAGRHADAPDVAARALLGAGALASNRGNYPESRTLYRRALRAATRAESAFLVRASHHGLLYAAFAAHDLDAALTHGWAALRRLPNDATAERAETLINLGEVGLQAGEHRAALGACLSAVELTDVPRLRLPALGTAARAAAALKEYNLLDFLAREVERAVVRSGQHFENARALVEFAEAFDGVRNGTALQYAARARDLAASGAFHEITARADGVLSGAAVPKQQIPPAQSCDVVTRTPRALAVLRTLEVLPAARRYHGLAAC